MQHIAPLALSGASGEFFNEERLGIEGLPPLSLFTLDEIGIQQKKFINDIAGTFDDLPLDPYDKQQRRSRSIAKYDVLFRGGSPSIERVPAGEFVQYNLQPGDVRAKPRRFTEASPDVAEHEGTLRLLATLAETVRQVRGQTRMMMTLHQVLLRAPYTLPDGTHRDGCRFILSALPIVLENTRGGMSTVFDARKEPLLSMKLPVGTGLFHADGKGEYWHALSDLQKGKRGTLGVDIQY